MTNTPTDEREVAESQEESDTLLPQRGEGPAASEAEPIPFWQRPYVERFLVPLVLPVAVIVAPSSHAISTLRPRAKNSTGGRGFA